MKTLVVVLVVLCVAGSTMAGTYNVVTDWVQAPGSPANWSFGSSLVIGSDFSQSGTHQSIGVGDVWWNGGEPWVAYAFPTWGWVTEGDHVYLHPGPAVENNGPGLASVARLTMPEAGVFNIAGMFDGRDTGTKDVYVLLNGTPLFSQLALSGTADAAFNLTGVSLSIGDRLDFVVDATTNFAGTCTGLEATVVPEPATMALLGLGGLLLRKRK